jgi:hypothetical protein
VHIPFRYLYSLRFNEPFENSRKPNAARVPLSKYVERSRSAANLQFFRISVLVEEIRVLEPSIENAYRSMQLAVAPNRNRVVMRGVQRAHRMPRKSRDDRDIRVCRLLASLHQVLFSLLYCGMVENSPDLSNGYACTEADSHQRPRYTAKRRQERDMSIMFLSQLTFRTWCVAKYGDGGKCT